MDNNQKWKNAFIATIVILVVVVIAIVILIIIGAVFLDSTVNTLYITFYNTNECTTAPYKCGYLQINPVQPTVFGSNFDTTLALLGAQLCMNSEYLAENNSLNIPSYLTFVANIGGCGECGYPEVFKTVNVNNPSAYAVVDNDTKTLYIAYRGVVNDAEWMYSFLFQEQYFGQTPLLLIPLSSSSQSVTEVPCASDTVVHTGFYDIFNQIKDTLTNVVVKHSNLYNKIVVYGHSLGGALASLSALYLKQTVTSVPIYVYTFGKPRVGNPSYAACVDANFGTNFWRIENQAGTMICFFNFLDLLPVVPIAEMPNFSDPQNPYLYNQDGTLWTYQSSWGSNTLNHSLNNYINALSPLGTGSSSSLSKTST